MTKPTRAAHRGPQGELVGIGAEDVFGGHRTHLWKKTLNLGLSAVPREGEMGREKMWWAREGGGGEARLEP